MIELSANTFYDFVAAQPSMACILHRGPFPACADAVGKMRGAKADEDPWVWARLDLSRADEIAAMFQIAGNEPYLLIMRDRIVLYCEPLSSAEPQDTRVVLDRAAQLDMRQVQATLDQERASRASLFERRVCPTARRGP